MAIRFRWWSRLSSGVLRIGDAVQLAPELWRAQLRPKFLVVVKQTGLTTAHEKTPSTELLGVDLIQLIQMF